MKKQRNILLYTNKKVVLLPKNRYRYAEEHESLQRKRSLLMMDKSGVHRVSIEDNITRILIVRALFVGPDYCSESFLSSSVLNSTLSSIHILKTVRANSVSIDVAGLLAWVFGSISPYNVVGKVEVSLIRLKMTKGIAVSIRMHHWLPVDSEKDSEKDG